MPKTPDYFSGKTIVITGAGSGIGRATALIFAREGANVVCADINGAGVTETVEQVNAKSGQALALTIDVTKRAAVEDMVQLAIDGFGSVQFLFNSAGAAVRRSQFLDIDDDLFDRTFDLNVKGTLYAMKAVLPHMLKNQFGVIVNMGSMTHRRGGPMWGWARTSESNIGPTPRKEGRWRPATSSSAPLPPSRMHRCRSSGRTSTGPKFRRSAALGPMTRRWGSLEPMRL